MDFDRYALKYDIDLHKGIRLSGERKDYFARERLRPVREQIARIGMKPRRIIEFGCGIGTNVGYIADLCPASEIIGLDISEESLTVAQRELGHRGIRFMTPEEYRRTGEARADWVFVSGVFHHIPVPERAEALRFLRTLLDKGGILTLFDNNPYSLPARVVMRLVPFDRDAVLVNPYQLMSDLRVLGFEDVIVRFLFVLPRLLSFLRPLEVHLEEWPIGAQYGVFARWQRP